MGDPALTEGQRQAMRHGMNCAASTPGNDHACTCGLLYRDIFAEITAKAIPVCDPASDDPERVRYYRVPVGPIHRAAGKVGFQMFDGEAHMTKMRNRIRALEERLRLTGNLTKDIPDDVEWPGGSDVDQ